MVIPVDTTAGNALHSAALAYAALGWPVFPLRPRLKTPLYGNPHPKDSPERGTCGGWHECGRFGHGVLDATTDRTVIDE
ncbi:MAG TPA: bifunctional DNA primase/polymerase, partial [Kofleriaceae bacterium]